MSLLFKHLDINSIIALLLTAISIFVARFYYKFYTRHNPLPGPIPIPFIGTFFVFKKDLDAWFFELKNKYGDLFEVTIGSERHIILCRAEYIRKMMAPTTNSYTNNFKLKALTEALDLEKKGLSLNDDFESWKFNRKIFAQAFTPSFVDLANKWSNELFGEMGEFWMGLMNTKTKEKGASEDAVIVDIAAWLRRFTNDLVSTLITGKRLHTMQFHYHKLKNEKVLSEEILESERFVISLNYLISEMSIMMFVPKYLRGLPIIKGMIGKYIDNRRDIFGKFQKIISERKKEIKEAIDNNIELRHDLLTACITANTQYDINANPLKDDEDVEPKLRPMTDDEIRANMLEAFLGATDTTINSLCFVIYHISRHPNVKKRLVEEIESVLDGDMTRPITIEDLKNLKYCEAVIRETTRLRTTIHMVGRYNNMPEEVGGYKWPENTHFKIYIRAINNNPLYWEEPDEFNPDRFIDSQLTEKNSFIMFGGGLRICPGKGIAMTEMKVVLASLYRKFDVELADINEPLNLTTNILISFCKELNVKISPREKRPILEF